MKAIVYHTYGSPDVLRYEEIEKPTPGDDDVLVRVRAAAVNPMDRYLMRGEPIFVRAMGGLRKPTKRLGVDLAGEVETVGRNVRQLEPGDAVFGVCRGAFAEYVCAHEDRLALKPANITLEQAAAIPIAGLTALQGIRDSGRVQRGQHVLITGAAGGVGTFAVQIAKSFGAQVTGVCSTRNVGHVLSIGADRVIDYTREDFTRSAERYDLILSTAGSYSWSGCRRIMTSSGIFAWVGGSFDHWARSMTSVLSSLVLSRFVSQKMVGVRASVKKDDLIVLKELVEGGKVTPVVGMSCALADAADAMRYLEEGHPRGKAVLTVGSRDNP